MRMTVTTYEGTVEEIKQIQRELQKEERKAAVAIDPADESSPGAVSTEVAYRAMTRIRLSKEQLAVLRVIYDAHPNWVLATALQRKTGYSTSQFAGLMGAFGRRVANTEGYIDYTHFFEQKWDFDKACNRYRLPDSVRAAYVRAGLDVL